MPEIGLKNGINESKNRISFPTSAFQTDLFPLNPSNTGIGLDSRRHIRHTNVVDQGALVLGGLLQNSRVCLRGPRARAAQTIPFADVSQVRSAVAGRVDSRDVVDQSAALQ